MKKFTLMMSLVVLASIAFAQVVGVHAPAATKDKLQKVNHSQLRGDEVVYWEVTFEEDEPIWTFGYDVGEKSWNVTDQAGAPATWEPSPGSYYLQYLGDYSETGNEVDGHWAWVDIISDYPGLGGDGQEVCNTWIQFDSINLLESDNPKINFYQMYRPLNSVATYVDISIDDGATWNTIEVNGDVLGNDYAPIQSDLYIGGYAANEPNVSIRFRWETSAVSSVAGYGWEIDDIKIVENPAVDMFVKEGVMNFFQYVDYTNPADADYFHISSHYGQIPEEQFESAAAVMVFNGILESKGYAEVIPEFNVTVFDPDMTEIYNETVTAPAYNITELDTVDVSVELALDTEPMRGEYTVIYNVIATNEENPEDNIDTTYFNVTDEIMGRDLGNMTSTVSPVNWQDGGVDGDMMGTDYLFLYETTILTMDVFIADRSTTGTSFVAHVMEYDDIATDYVDLGASGLIVVDSSMLDTWVTVTFPDPITIIPDSETGDFEVKAAVELFFGDGDLFIGADPTTISSSWGTTWYFMEGDSPQEWRAISNYGGAGIGLRLNTPKSNAIAPINADNVNVYPNPSTGHFTIENVRGADVEIFNLVGQRVYLAQNVDQNINVDLSNLSEGTYIVKVSGTNTFKTQKINIVK